MKHLQKSDITLLNRSGKKKINEVIIIFYMSSLPKSVYKQTRMCKTDTSILAHTHAHIHKTLLLVKKDVKMV